MEPGYGKKLYYLRLRSISAKEVNWKSGKCPCSEKGTT